MAGLLLLPGCRDGSPAGPETSPPVLHALSPASGTPAESPLTVVLTGQHLRGVSLEAPPSVFLEVSSSSDAELRMRVGFRGGPPGLSWIRASNAVGADSIPFLVEPLPEGDSLTETRALWVSRFEFASARDVVEIMERAGEAGFNLVYFQVRGRADAFYRSSLEPWAANLTGVLGQDPGWDPLQVAVDEGSARGLSVHAWINAFTGWAGTEPPPASAPLHAFLEHPDWAMVDQGGASMPYQSGSRWMSPGHPGARTRLARVAADIVRNYGVDGIHLDFIRYPSTEYSYDAPSLAAFDSLEALEPGLGFDEMRRRFVTWAVREARDSMNIVDPSVELSAAVWGIYRNVRGWPGVSTGYESVLQDAREWDRLGIVDALAPMVYWTIQPEYGDQLDFAYLADEHAYAVQRPVFIGTYVPGMNGVDLARHIERARMSGAEGVVLFSYSALDEADLWGALATWAFFWPARRGPALPSPSPVRMP